MKIAKKYLLPLVYVILFSLSSLYIFTQFLSYKITNELNELSSLSYTIQQLKDVHILCMLDYKYNTNSNILVDCKKVGDQLFLSVDKYNNSTPYLNFYTEYIQKNK